MRISPSTVVSFDLYPSKADSAFIGGGERAGYERYIPSLGIAGVKVFDIFGAGRDNIRYR